MVVHLGLSQPMLFHATDSVNRENIYKPKFNLSVQYHRSILLMDPGKAAKYNFSAPYEAISFRVSKESYGQRLWHQLYHYPEFGLGLYQGFFYLPHSKPGNPTAVYGFFNAPFKRKRNWESRYEIALGLVYNFTGDDPPPNSDLIYNGSRENVYLSLAYENQFIISSRFRGLIGCSFLHMSNGYTHTPNPGINVLSLDFRLKYLAQKTTTQLEENNLHSNLLKHSIPAFTPLWEYYMVVSGGWKTIGRDSLGTEIYYPVFSSNIDIARHYSYKGKFGIGLDVFYDGTLAEDYQYDYNTTGDVPNHLLWYYGLHIGHEWMIHRFTIITQLGWMFKDVKDRSRRYGRVAFRYDISKHVFVRIGLKLPSSLQSDFLEWGIGFNLYK